MVSVADSGSLHAVINDKNHGDFYKSVAEVAKCCGDDGC